MRRWPVVPYRGILSPFGASRASGTRLHAGVDLGALIGDAIVSMDVGTVLYPVTGFSIGAGLQALAVQHPDAQYIYAEIGSPLVKAGDHLEAGQRIATAAKNADGNSMLHLEAWTVAPHAFTPWTVPGDRPAGLLDVQARLPMTDEQIVKEAAAALAKARPGLPVAPSLILLGQARGESNFGYAIPAPDGTSSYNWGAIYANGDRGRIPFVDPSGAHVGAAWNSSPEVGARQLAGLIEGSYAPATERAYVGDVWGYARALWRSGPGSKRPAYYEGFKPGDKRGTTPAGVPAGSPLDAWYRVGAYAQLVMASAKKVASILGLSPASLYLAPPAAPGDLTAFASSSSSSSGGGALLLAIVAAAGYAAWKG